MTENNNSEKLDELTSLLKESIKISQEDRKIAKQNYNDLKQQLEIILETGVEGSEEYKLEREVNNALKHVFASGDRMEKVIDSITKVMVAQLNAESKEAIANNIFGGGGWNGSKKVIDSPVNIKKLLEDNQ